MDVKSLDIYMDKRQKTQDNTATGIVVNVTALSALVRINGASEPQEVRLSDSVNIQPGDRVFLMRTKEARIRWQIISSNRTRVVTTGKILKQAYTQLSPPSDVNAFGVVGAIVVEWSDPIIYRPTFEVQTNTSASEIGATLQNLVASSPFIISTATELYARVRAVSHEGEYSSWSAWANATPETFTAGTHTHVLADITDAGLLAGLNTVGTAQIDNNAIDATKLLETDDYIVGSATMDYLRVYGTSNVQQAIIRANATQTANLQEWQDSSGTSLTVVNESGKIGIGTALPTANLTIVDSATTPPLNITKRSSAPNVPSANDIYLDDGTNTNSGNPLFRRYTGATWEDIGGGVSGGGGETNTASNIGIGGVGVFDGKIGLDLQFKNINAGSTKITITDDSANNKIDVDVSESNLTLNNIGGTLSVSKGGTGSTTASGARTNLDAQEDLSGAVITSATVATNDKILIQDVDDSDNLKTVTVQSVADLADTITYPASSTDNAIVRFDGTGGDSIQNSGVLIDDNDRLTLPDSTTIPPLNITERSAEPTTPSSNDIYLDDGTNTSSGNPSFRRYTGSTWEDIGGGAGGGGGNNLEYTANESADYTTTSTLFVDVDATNFALTITTNGGNCLVGFTGFVRLGGAATQYVHFNVDVDGSPQFADDGLGGAWNNGTWKLVSFVVLIEGLTAASHTFKLQWKSQIGGKMTLYAGAGTSNNDVHPQFWVQEI